MMKKMPSKLPGKRTSILAFTVLIASLLLHTSCSYHLVKQTQSYEYSDKIAQAIKKDDSVFIKSNNRLYHLSSPELVENGLRGVLRVMDYNRYKADSLILSRRNGRVKKAQKAIFKKVYIETELVKPSDSFVPLNNINRIVIINHHTVKEMANVATWISIGAITASAAIVPWLVNAFSQQDK